MRLCAGSGGLFDVSADREVRDDVWHNPRSVTVVPALTAVTVAYVIYPVRKPLWTMFKVHSFPSLDSSHSKNAAEGFTVLALTFPQSGQYIL